MKKAAAQFVTLLTLVFAGPAFAQVVGLQPTPIGIYDWNPVTNEWDAATNASTANPYPTTPQAYAFYGWNASLGQWTPCTSMANCGFGSGITWPTSGGLILSNETNAPAALAPVNGECAVGSGGAWTVGSCGSSVIIQTNGTNNASQSTLNLVAGAGITLTNTSGGNVQISSTGGTISGSGTLGFIPLWTPNVTTLGNSHLDDGVTSSGKITSSEPFNAINTSSGGGGQSPLTGVNNGTSSTVIVSGMHLCPNMTTGMSGGCAISVGRSAAQSDDNVAFLDFQYNGATPGQNRGFLGMGSSAGLHAAIGWDWNQNVYLPILLNAASLATDANGKIIAGSGGGTTTNPLTAATTGGAAPGTTFNGSAPVTFDYHSFGAAGISGTPATGNCVDWASSNTLGDTGSPCGSGGGGSPGGVSGSIQYNNAGAFGGIDMGATANVPLVSNGSHGAQLASGTLSTNGTGTSIYNVTTTTIGNLGTLTGLTANASVVMVTDGATCGDTSTGGGSVNETLRYLGSSTWGVIGCGPVGSVTPNGLFSQVMYTPTTTSSGFTTALNQSTTFSATNNATGITVADTTPQSGTNTYEGIVGAYPSSPFTKTFLFSTPQPSKTGSNWAYAGLIVTSTTASTSPAMQFFFGTLSGTCTTIEVQGITNLTHSGTGTNIASTASNFCPAYLWLQYHDDGTNLYFSYSLDGSNWVQLYSVAKSSSYLVSQGGSLNYLGVFLYNGASSGQEGYTLLSYH